MKRLKYIFIKVFYALIIRPWLTLFIGVKFENREIFDDKNQFIVVANHNSHFDMVSIMAALPGRKLKHIRSIAAGDYFGKSKFTTSITQFFFNSIMISRKRKEGEPSGIEVLDDCIKRGKSLVLFPEGSRGQPGVIAEFKSGIAIILKKNPGVPFIPVYLDGFGRVMPKDKTIILPMVCKIRFGEPIYIDSSKDVDSILEEVKAAILGLKNTDEEDRNQFTY